MSAALDIFRALSDPTRLRIIYLLRAMELAVGEIAQVVGQSQPRVSRHVRILAKRVWSSGARKAIGFFCGWGKRRRSRLS